MFIFTAAPGFLLAATVKSAYNVLVSPEGDRVSRKLNYRSFLMLTSFASLKKRRKTLQEKTRYFYGLLEESPHWRKITDKGCLRITACENWRESTFIAPIVPLLTREGRCVDLRNKLFRNGFLAHSARYPAVPKDAERVRVVIHVDNSEDHIEGLVKAIIEWACDELNEKQSSVLEARARL